MKIRIAYYDREQAAADNLVKAIVHHDPACTVRPSTDRSDLHHVFVTYPVPPELDTVPKAPR